MACSSLGYNDYRTHTQAIVHTVKYKFASVYITSKTQSGIAYKTWASAAYQTTNGTSCCFRTEDKSTKKCHWIGSVLHLPYLTPPELCSEGNAVTFKVNLPLMHRRCYLSNHPLLNLHGRKQIVSWIFYRSSINQMKQRIQNTAFLHADYHPTATIKRLARRYA